MNNNAAQSLGDAIFRNRTGLVVGALLGLMSGGLAGLFFGGVIGFLAQRAIRGALVGAVSHHQQQFFEATFSVMGKVAKSDGQVSETEIQYARDVMARMNLSELKRREAIELFSRGKQGDFEIGSVVSPLARFRPELKQMFIEIQLQAAFADGQVSQAELLVIQESCSLLRISFQDLQMIMNRIRAEQAFNQQSYSNHQQGAVNSAALLKEAYGVLGVASSVGEADLKKAYRRLMNQHHPDKLIAKGLPEEMMQLAKEKTQEIQAAYDRVKEARKAGF